MITIFQYKKRNSVTKDRSLGMSRTCKALCPVVAGTDNNLPAEKGDGAAATSQQN